MEPSGNAHRCSERQRLLDMLCMSTTTHWEKHSCDSSLEWYHLQCIGLKNPPNGLVDHAMLNKNVLMCSSQSVLCNNNSDDNYLT